MQKSLLGKYLGIQDSQEGQQPLQPNTIGHRDCTNMTKEQLIGAKQNFFENYIIIQV